jgi:Phosphotransferase enzyme family
VAQAARARARRAPRDRTRPPRRAVDRVVGGVGRAGAAGRALHDAPLPTRSGRSLDELASQLDRACEWLVANDVLPAGVATRNRRLADTALRPCTPVFIHRDLQVDHVFVDGDEVTGIIDWSEASEGDALFDLATLTLGHEEHRSLVVGDDNLDLLHVGHHRCRPPTPPGFIASDCAAERVPRPCCLMHVTDRWRSRHCLGLPVMAQFEMGGGSNRASSAASGGWNTRTHPSRSARRMG